MKVEQSEGSETSAYKIQMLGYYQKKAYNIFQNSFCKFLEFAVHFANFLPQNHQPKNVYTPCAYVFTVHIYLFQVM